MTTTMLEPTAALVERDTKSATAPPSPDDLERIEAYDYVLPPELIAERPAARREASRLMEITAGEVRHHATFEALPGLLRAGDLLVVNDVRVQPVRLFARRASGGRVEVLVLNEPFVPVEPAGIVARCFMRARRALRPDETLTLEIDGQTCGVTLRVGERHDDGATPVTFAIDDGDALDALFEQAGQLPLPPYIVKRRRATGQAEYTDDDAARYQTVYARQGRAVAAPTAGLHFSQDILATLAQHGIERAALTLDVGPGTFRPVRTDHLDAHDMHSERYVIDEALREAVARTRQRGGRIIAVGTTVVRALEDQALRHDGGLRPGRYETRLFIRARHRFASVDGLLTNFHLPRSTLLVLVCALAGHRAVMGAYAEAVAQRYRFYSYGDCMLVWPAAEARP